MKRLPCSFLVSVLSGLLFFACGLRADTPTSTPTPTPTGTPSATPTPTATETATPTPTPGPGSYSYVVYNSQLVAQNPPFLVPGNTGNSLEIDYVVTSALAPQGVLVFQFPPDLGGALGLQPNPTLTPASFYVQPAYQNDFSYAISGLYVSVTTNTTINAGTVLQFIYGQGGTGGFTMPGIPAQTSESVGLAANTQPPLEANAAGVGVVPAPAPIPVWSATITPTPTITPTFTVSPTVTASPTITVTWTVTNTYTLTPVGPVRAALGFYTYPNPFDMRQQSCVTVRFPPTTEPVEITIFSLVGNPVYTVPAAAIQNFLGVAQWCGTDDYGRTVPGGLYFVRLKTPSQTWVHKMTVFH